MLTIAIHILKYSLVAVSVVGIIISLILLISFLSGINELNYPKTLIGPCIGILFFISGFVVLMMQCLSKKSQEKSKTLVIANIVLFIFAITAIAITPIINGGITGAQEVIKAESGYFLISLDDFKDRFNQELDGKYNKIQAYAKIDDKKGKDEKGCFATLTDGIEVFLLTDSSESKISFMNLNYDMDKGKDDAEVFGYYIAKLIFAVNGNTLSKEEVSSIIDNLDFSNVLENMQYTFKDIMYYKQIDDKIRFVIFPPK